jgi:NACHT domain
MNWDFFTNWSWPTAIITGLALPVLTVVILAIRKAFVKWSRYAIDAGLYVVGKYVTHRVASVVTLRQYASRELGGRSRELLVPAREDIPLQTDEVYVPLALEGPLAEKRYDHASITQCGTRIRVIGEPGSGKTTVLKRILRDECRRALRKASAARFPIMFELKHLNPPTGVPDDELGDWFFSIIESDLQNVAVFNMRECIGSYLSHKGVLLLLDGADEINSSAYSRAQQAINQLSYRLRQLSENNVIILTMRKQFYQQTRVDFAAEFPQVLEAKPFSASDIYRFLSVWPFKENAQANIARIFADLVDRPTLREMCANPLVLSMYVAEDQLTGHPLVPESRTVFYVRVAEELLIRRRASQVGAPAGAQKIREDRERLLGQLAFEHILNEREAPNLILWKDALRITAEVYVCEPSQAEERLRDLAVNTGLISEERPNETLRFIHLTFREFFAAKYAIRGRRTGWQELIASYKDFSSVKSSVASSRLDQVIPFAAGLAPSYHAREDAISDVLALDNSRISGLCFLETKLYEHPKWIEYSKERMKTLLSMLKDDPEEAWLLDLHLFAVVSRDLMITAEANPGAYALLQQNMNVDEFFEGLGTAGEAGLRRILMAYSARDPVAAFRIAALCEFDVMSKLPELIIENRDDPGVLALAIEAATTNGKELLECASVLAACIFMSEVAAKAIENVALTNEWAGLVECADRENRWDRLLERRSALSDILTIHFGSARPLEGRSDVGGSQGLGDVSSPGQLLRERKGHFVNVVLGSVGEVA